MEQKQEWPEMMDVSALAGYLQISERTARNMLVDGRLPGFKAGREWRVLKSVVDEHLRQRQTLKA